MKLFKGLTLIEVTIVIGIVSLLYFFISSNLFRSRNITSLDTSITSLINDIKGQQIQAMTGFNQYGERNNFYGIYFESDKYILFHSSTYQLGLSTNFPITLENNNQFSPINLPDNQIIFSSSSGKISNFNSSNHSVTIRNINSNDQRTINFNSYGVIDDVN